MDEKVQVVVKATPEQRRRYRMAKAELVLPSMAALLDEGLAALEREGRVHFPQQTT